MNKAQVRRSMRAKRKQLSDAQLYHASEAIKILISNTEFFQKAHHMGFYLAIEGEMDPAPLRELAENRSKFVYLPVIYPANNSLYFSRYRTGEPLTPNQYGINEPHATPINTLPPEGLDVAIVPMVGFARDGFRLGMGAGYYDRTFDFRKQNQNSCKPLLVGIAHSFQEVTDLPCEAWDVPLDVIVTEQEIIQISPALQNSEI